MAENTDPHLLTLFDRRVGKIEDGQENLSKQMQCLSAQMQSQSETLNQMSTALTAVVRLEERLTSSIENGKDQKQSIQRVHDRMDDTLQVLAKSARDIREQFDRQAAERDEALAAVYQRIESERKDCAERFQPVNDTINQQAGALKFTSVVFPVLATLVMGVGGWFCVHMYSELRATTAAVAKHETEAAEAGAQVRQMRKELDTKGGRGGGI